MGVEPESYVQASVDANVITIAPVASKSKVIGLLLHCEVERLAVRHPALTSSKGIKLA